MSQLSLYINKELLSKIEKAARRENKSISKWVSSKLDVALNKSWPVGYFSLYGILKEYDIERPDQGSFSQDTKRETL